MINKGLNWLRAVFEHLSTANFNLAKPSRFYIERQCMRINFLFDYNLINQILVLDEGDLIIKDLSKFPI